MVHQSQFIEQIGDSRSNPRKWDVFTLKEIVLPSCPISYGIVQPGDDLPDGVPIVRPVDLDETHVVTSKGLKKTSKEISEAYKRTVLKGDELLLCVRGTTGLVGLATPELKGCNVTRGITPLAFKDSIDRVFMLCMFLSDGIQEFIADNTIGSALRGINMSVIRDMKIPVPPLDVQRHFARLYKQADKSKFDGLKSQFIEMFREVTKTKVHLKDIATYTIGLTYKPENVKGEGVPVMRSGNILDGNLVYEDLVRVDSTIPKELYLRDGDILMCSRNGSAHLVGKVARVRELPEPISFGAFMTTIRSAYVDYLYLYFQSAGFREQIAYGKSSTMNQITQKMLDQIEIDLPSKEEISKLTPLLYQVDKSKYLN